MNETAARNSTLEDVAAQAGVSSATVSRFINNPKVVAEATASRIRSAIAATGYIPNLLAGGLASSKSKMVAVLIPHLTDSIFNDTIEAMVDELANAGMTVMLGLTGVSQERTDELILAALSRRVDAIISTGPTSPKTAQMVRRGPSFSFRYGSCPRIRWASPSGFPTAMPGAILRGFWWRAVTSARIWLLPKACARASAATVLSMNGKLLPAVK